MLLTKASIELRDGTAIHITARDKEVDLQEITWVVKYPDGQSSKYITTQPPPWERAAEAIEQMDRDWPPVQ